MNLNYLKELLVDVKASGIKRISVCEKVKIKLDDALRELKLEDDRLSSIDFPMKETDDDAISRFYRSKN